MKRFYKDVSVKEEGGAFRILLDGRTLKTQAKATLEVPTRALADGVAKEWADVGENIDPTVMPLTRLSFAAIDGVKADRAKVSAHALSFGGTDLLTSRANTPAELIKRQSEAWDPLLTWAADKHGAKLNVTPGISHVEQPARAMAALQKAIDVQ